MDQNLTLIAILRQLAADPDKLTPEQEEALPEGSCRWATHAERPPKWRSPEGNTATGEALLAALEREADIEGLTDEDRIGIQRILNAADSRRRINRNAYEALIQGDLDVLASFIPSANLERRHIEEVLRASVDTYYLGPKLIRLLREAEKRAQEAEERAGRASAAVRRWDQEALSLLENTPGAIRVCEGGGLEDIRASLAVTWMALLKDRATLAEIRKPAEDVDPAEVIREDADLCGKSVSATMLLPLAARAAPLARALIAERSNPRPWFIIEDEGSTIVDATSKETAWAAYEAAIGEPVEPDDLEYEVRPVTARDIDEIREALEEAELKASQTRSLGDTVTRLAEQVRRLQATIAGVGSASDEATKRMMGAAEELELIRTALGNGADEELWPPGKTVGEAVADLALECGRIRATLGNYPHGGPNWHLKFPSEKVQKLSASICLDRDLSAVRTPVEHVDLEAALKDAEEWARLREADDYDEMGGTRAVDRNLLEALCDAVAPLVREVARVRGELERTVPDSWDGLLTLLDRHYPADLTAPGRILDGVGGRLCRAIRDTFGAMKQDPPRGGKIEELWATAGAAIPGDPNSMTAERRAWMRARLADEEAHCPGVAWQEWLGSALLALEAAELKLASPINVVLHCPRCFAQHIDAPEPGAGWTNPVHRSHTCHACNLVFRHSDAPTNGVYRATTRGKADWSEEDIESPIPGYLGSEEGRALGVVVEINRQLLHPVGLAAEVEMSSSTLLMRIQDRRDDPEGMIYDWTEDRVAKVLAFEAFEASRTQARHAALGYFIQPLPNPQHDVLIQAGADTEGPREEGCDCANPPPFPGVEGGWGVSVACPIHGDGEIDEEEPVS
jgi:hypothetical protein